MKQSIKVCLFFCMGIYSLQGAAAEASALAEVLFNGVAKGGAKIVKKRPAVQSSLVPLFKNPAVKVQRGKGLRAWPKDIQKSGFHKTAYFQNKDEEKAEKNSKGTRLVLADPKVDLTFKMIFCQANEALVITLLNEILDLRGPHTIKEVQFLDVSSGIEFDKSKLTFVDVRCIDYQGRSFVVEMQRKYEPSYLKRVSYYCARDYVRQLKSPFSRHFRENRITQDPYESLKPVYVVSFLEKELFPNKKSYLSRHRITDIETQENDLKDLNWVFIELPKFEEQNASLKTPLEEFLYLMNSWDKINDVPFESQIRPVYETLNQLTWSREMLDAYENTLFQQESYESVLKYQREESIKEGLKEGLKEGQEKGLKEGRTQASMDIALKLITRGLTNLEIAEDTGLQASEVEKLRAQSKK